MVTMVSFLFSLFTLNTHPLSLALLLMLTSLAYALMVAFSSNTPWLAYMLVLVFLSGMMIMILYMTSLSSNENTVLNPMVLVFSLTMALMLPYSTNLKISSSTLELNNFFKKNSFELIYKTYNKMLNEMSLIMITYLLVVLIVAVKIISLSKGPMKMNE